MHSQTIVFKSAGLQMKHMSIHRASLGADELQPL